MLKQEQELVREWLARQPFGAGQQPWEPLLGVVEELGELCRAHLKEHQKIRGTADEHVAKAKDSVGDCVIYLLGFCINVGIDVSDCQVVYNYSDTYHTGHGCLLKAAKACGNLTNLWAFGPPTELLLTERYVGEFLGWLMQYCKTRTFAFQACVDLAMDEVMARDWAANPQTGVKATVYETSSIAGGKEEVAVELGRVKLSDGSRLVIYSGPNPAGTSLVPLDVLVPNGPDGTLITSERPITAHLGDLPNGK